MVRPSGRMWASEPKRSMAGLISDRCSRSRTVTEAPPYMSKIFRTYRPRSKSRGRGERGESSTVRSAIRSTR